MGPAPSDPPLDRIARASLQGKRLGLGVVIAIAVSLIGASAAQIIPAAFGAGVSPLPQATPGGPEHVCAVGVRVLAQALDRACSGPVRQPASTAGADETVAAFRRALSPEWDDTERVAQACAETRQGLEAWAALQRLRTAAEQLVHRDRLELQPLRDDVAAHLPPDLR